MKLNSFLLATVIWFFGVCSLFASSYVKSTQIMLNQLGYSIGYVDGVAGEKTNDAIRRFYSKNAKKFDGKIDENEVNALKIAISKSGKLDFTGQNISPVLPDSVIKTFSTNNKVITDVKNRNYSFCSPKNLDWTGKNIWNLNKFFEDYTDYFSPDYVKTFANTKTGELIDGEEVYSLFEEGLIEFQKDLLGQHHNCLFSQIGRSCSKIIDITKKLSETGATIAPSAPISSTDIPFTTIEKLLIPTIISYSTAIQVLGEPQSHSMIGRWFEDALNANVFNTKTGKGVDLFRSKNDFKPNNNKFGCFDSAQNHSLNSGFLYMAYAVIWGDLEKFSIGWEQLKYTLQSVKSDGALACEVTRGPNSLFYSGATIHTMLQIIHLIHLQNINYDDLINLEPLHNAVAFQIDAGLNPKKLEKYTKRFSENYWCKPYKGISGQCMYERPKRNTSFGWIQLYIKLFPIHKNTQKLEKLFNEFQTIVVENKTKRLNLNAIFQPNQIKKSLKLNYEDIIEPWEKEGTRADDSSMIHFNDSHGWGRGSPLCLYGLSNKFSKKAE